MGGRGRGLELARVALAGLSASPIDSLAQRLKAAAPGVERASFALVDSPRWPRDLDWSRGAHPREPVASARKLDSVMRAVYRALVAEPKSRRNAAAADGSPSALRALSMFPTPRYAYFAHCAEDPRCKPHLRAIAHELFGALMDDSERASGRVPRDVRRVSGGAIFTRFMLAGFATYRALERLGVTAFESYPDLQFRLAAPSVRLAPKHQRPAAMATRKRIVRRLAAELNVQIAHELKSFDQLDAALLALAAANAMRRGALAVASDTREGRFIFALDARQAHRLGLEPA